MSSVTTPHQARARVAALSRSRVPNDPDMVDARRELAAANITAYIQKVVADAPPLTSEQTAQISAILGGIADIKLDIARVQQQFANVSALYPDSAS